MNEIISAIFGRQYKMIILDNEKTSRKRANSLSFVIQNCSDFKPIDVNLRYRT
jgi:hypothetical protein